jgi:hypothetical protein
VLEVSVTPGTSRVILSAGRYIESLLGCRSRPWNASLPESRLVSVGLSELQFLVMASGKLAVPGSNVGTSFQ